MNDVVFRNCKVFYCFLYWLKSNKIEFDKDYYVIYIISIYINLLLVVIIYVFKWVCLMIFSVLWYL